MITKILLILLAIIQLSLNTDCIDGTTCPGNKKCCASKDGFTCCPYSNGVCCSDMNHCCPSQHTCTDKGICIPSNRTQNFMENIETIEYYLDKQYFE